MGLSNDSELNFMQHNFFPAGGAYTPFPVHHISLHDGDPADTGANEIVGGGYGRFEVTTIATFWTAAAARAIQNAVEATFPNMPAANVSHCGIWSSSAGGVFMAGDAIIGGPKSVGAGEEARFPAGTLRILFDAIAYTNYLANNWLDLQFRGQIGNYTRPSGHTLQIYDGDPAVAGTPIAGASAQALTFNAPAQNDPRYDSTNNGDISFTTLTGGDTLDHWGVRDTEVAENLLASFNQVPQSVGAGDDAEILDGQLVLGVN